MPRQLLRHEPTSRLLIRLGAVTAALFWACTLPGLAWAEAPEAVEVALPAPPGTAGAVEVNEPAPAPTPVLLAELTPMTPPAPVPVTPDTAAPTESAAPPVLLLPDAVATALAYSPGLSALAWQALAQWEQADSVDGRGRLGTEFSLTAFQTDSPLGVFGTKLSQGRVTQADFDPARLNNPDWLGSVEYKLKLTYPLFTSGRIELLADALRLNGEALDFDRLQAQHDLTAKVIELYFAHSLLNEQVLVLSDASLTVAELKRMIESLEREGLVVKADIAAVEVEVANIADEADRAQSNLTLTETVLALLLGQPTAPFTTVIELDPAVLEVPELEQATATALANRPDLLAMERRVCAATNLLNEGLRQQNPTLGAFAEGKHVSSGLPGEGNTEATIGAQIVLDLDTGGVIRHTIGQRRAELVAAQLGYDQLVDLAKIEVAQALAGLTQARSSLTTFQAQSANAAENLRVIRNRYREGLTNFLDVRMAVTTDKESRLRELKARYDVLLAYVNLLTVTGQLGGATDPLLSGYDPAAPAVAPVAAEPEGESHE